MATQHTEQSTTAGSPSTPSEPEGRPARSGRVRTEEVQKPRKSPSSGRSLTHSPFFCGALYEQMSELAGMSEQTHEGYLRAVRKLADFYQQSPRSDHRKSVAKTLPALEERQEVCQWLNAAPAGAEFVPTGHRIPAQSKALGERIA